MTHRLSRVLPLLAALTLGVACAGMPDTSGRLWPVANRDELSGGGGRVDVLWPLIEQISGPDRRETRVRPFYRRVVTGERTRVEALWPIYTETREPGRQSRMILPAWYDRRLYDDTGWNDRDWGLFPLLAGGSDPKEGDYFLLFPLWGNTRGLFGKDEMNFRFFPLYLDTRENGYLSTHLLWPLISWGEGDGRSDFRFLPFWSHREHEGKSWSSSVAWPFVSWGEDALDTAHPVKSLLVFPFFGRIDSDVAWSRMVAFPLYLASGAKGGYRDLNVLWPVFRSRTGPDGPQSLRIWPLFSRTREGENREDWYLWPLVWDSDLMMGTERLRSLEVLPFFRSAVRTGVDGAPHGRELQIWPLFRRRVAADGSVHLTAFAPIPFVDLDPLEAAWSWSWTVLDHRSAGEGSSTDLLFGLVQFRSSPEGSYAGVPLLLEYAARGPESKVELLKGLLGYERSGDGAGLRILWGLRIGF